MKKNALILLTLTVIIIASSCKSSGSYRPNVSGGAFEVLLVIDEDVYRTSGGEAIFNVLNDAVPHLPQAEPMFKMSRLQHSMFDNLLKTTRNIVFVNVDSTKYTTPKIHLTRNRWAKTQAIADVVAPNTEELKSLLERDGHRIQEYFVKAERERMMNYYKSNRNKEASLKTNRMFGCNIAVPTSLNKYVEGDNFLWMTNGNIAGVRQDIIIYSVPYRSKNQLTHEAIIARRDSILKANVPGGVEGSYMGTELRYEQPTSEFIRLHDTWAAETRGLWKMYNGESMGGPFVSLTRIDELNQRIITIEGFVFAPGKDKRNPLRQMDAMVYSLLLPLEINSITVEVSGNNTTKTNQVIL